MTKKRTSLMEMAKSLNTDQSKPVQIPEALEVPETTQAPAKHSPQKAGLASKTKPIKEMEKDDLTAMHIRLPKEMHKRLQLQRIEEERPMNDIITEAIDTYLRRTSGPAKRRE